MADVWLAPYLPLNNEVEVGPYTLVPFKDFKRHHAASSNAYNEVRRLRTAYRIKDEPTQSFGALVLPTGGRIGNEDLNRDMFPLLHKALLAALIDANPPLPTDHSEGAAHATATAENASIFGHPLTGDRSYAIRTGVMVSVLQFHFSEPGRRLPPIPAPNDLPRPLFSSGFDCEYATALHETLAADDVASRRLALCIDWLNVSWNNSEAITAQVRVLVVRSAFEALLGGDSSTKENRELLSKLLDNRDAKKTMRSWTERSRKQNQLITDLEWWFQSFAILRNRIAHGEIAEDQEWKHEGQHHLHRADDILRRAIKRSVAKASGNPLLESSPPERAMLKAIRRARRSSST